jgi:hypothetical protein
MKAYLSDFTIYFVAATKALILWVVLLLIFFFGYATYIYLTYDSIYLAVRNLENFFFYINAILVYLIITTYFLYRARIDI